MFGKRKAQSTLEYIVIFTAIAALLVVAVASLQRGTNRYFGRIGERMEQAAEEIP